MAFRLENELSWRNLLAKFTGITTQATNEAPLTSQSRSPSTQSQLWRISRSSHAISSGTAGVFPPTRHAVLRLTWRWRRRRTRPNEPNLADGLCGGQPTPGHVHGQQHVQPAAASPTASVSTTATASPPAAATATATTSAAASTTTTTTTAAAAAAAAAATTTSLACRGQRSHDYASRFAGPKQFHLESEQLSKELVLEPNHESAADSVNLFPAKR